MAFLKKKPFPKRNATFKELFPPQKKYAYFENGQKHPFKFKAKRFQWVNCWWLAEASLLAYCDNVTVKKKLLQAASAAKDAPFFEQVEFFDRGGTECFVAHNRDFAIVAFRGTLIPGVEKERRAALLAAAEPPSIAKRVMGDVKKFFSGKTRARYFKQFSDIFTDVNLLLETDPPQRGKVHRGFKLALDVIWNPAANGDASTAQAGLKATLDAIRKRGKRLHGKEPTLWFTGHSLGAALATLAANRYKKVQGLYTFGSPMVGNPEFTQSFQVSQHFRIVNNRDIVALVPPRLPPFFDYCHLAGLRKITHPKPNRVGLETTESNEGFYSGGYDILSLISSIPKIPDGNLPGRLFDHCPYAYVAHAWNLYIKSLT